MRSPAAKLSVIMIAKVLPVVDVGRLVDFVVVILVVVTLLVGPCTS
jgi:hypothetical protein